MADLKEKRAYILSQNCFNPKTYESDYSFKPWDGVNPLGVHTTAEMLQCLDKYKNVELDARILGIQEGNWTQKKFTRKKFKEVYLSKRWDKLSFKEDFFGQGGMGGGFSGPVGSDFIPLLGGPFYKNLYYYQDYIRMHGDAFFAWNNDPFAHALTQITRDFVLGTGYEMQCDTDLPEGKLAMAAWKAFEEVNDFQEQTDLFCLELSIYGESMMWELPDNQTKIVYQLPNNQIPRGIIPRVRLIDPSNIVEIITYPEDITRPIAYIWLTPTQYQTYTGVYNPGETSEPIQPTLKFIYRQVPADQMMHFKVNCVSNEKRGRSDYFPIFPYLKRLRDSVDYSLIALQKVSAWAIDTAIKGDQTDIDAYVQAQRQMGTIPDAGSEHVHSDAITRQYLGNSNAGGHSSDVWEWCLSMIAAGGGVPISYYGSHLSGGSTRASALVATEPVAKKMEKRREVIKRMLTKTWSLVMKRAGLPLIDCNVIFPEIITQDRSAKLKDILLAETSNWIKPERAANMAAKELGIQNYNYQEELKDIQEQLPDLPEPLTQPGSSDSAFPQGPQGSGSSPKFNPGDAEEESSALTSQDKRKVKINDKHL